jgi:hypothetical protein
MTEGNTFDRPQVVSAVVSVISPGRRRPRGEAHPSPREPPPRRWSDASSSSSGAPLLFRLPGAAGYQRTAPDPALLRGRSLPADETCRFALHCRIRRRPRMQDGSSSSERVAGGCCCCCVRTRPLSCSEANNTRPGAFGGRGASHLAQSARGAGIFARWRVPHPSNHGAQDSASVGGRGSVHARLFGAEEGRDLFPSVEARKKVEYAQGDVDSSASSSPMSSPDCSPGGLPVMGRFRSLSFLCARVSRGTGCSAQTTEHESSRAFETPPVSRSIRSRQSGPDKSERWERTRRRRERRRQRQQPPICHRSIGSPWAPAGRASPFVLGGRAASSTVRRGLSEWFGNETEKENQIVPLVRQDNVDP